MRKNSVISSSMHRNWSSPRHFGVGNLSMDCMILSRDIGTFDFSPTGEFLSVGSSCNESGET